MLPRAQLRGRDWPRSAQTISASDCTRPGWQCDRGRSMCLGVHDRGSVQCGGLVPAVVTASCPGRGVNVKIGILMPIAETDSGTILRYSGHPQRSAAGGARRVRFGLDRRSSAVRMGWSTTWDLGGLDDTLRPWPRPRVASSWDVSHVHCVSQPGVFSPRWPMPSTKSARAG